jgi:hypothetical protein
MNPRQPELLLAVVFCRSPPRFARTIDLMCRIAGALQGNTVSPVKYNARTAYGPSLVPASCCDPSSLSFLMAGYGMHSGMAGSGIPNMGIPGAHGGMPLGMAGMSGQGVSYGANPYGHGSVMQSFGGTHRFGFAPIVSADVITWSSRCPSMPPIICRDAPAICAVERHGGATREPHARCSVADGHDGHGHNAAELRRRRDACATPRGARAPCARFVALRCLLAHGRR